MLFALELKREKNDTRNSESKVLCNDYQETFVSETVPQKRKRDRVKENRDNTRGRMKHNRENIRGRVKQNTDNIRIAKRQKKDKENGKDQKDKENGKDVRTMTINKYLPLGLYIQMTKVKC